MLQLFNDLQKQLMKIKLNRLYLSVQSRRPAAYESSLDRPLEPGATPAALCYKYHCYSHMLCSPRIYMMWIIPCLHLILWRGSVTIYPGGSMPCLALGPDVVRLSALVRVRTVSSKWWRSTPSPSCGELFKGYIVSFTWMSFVLWKQLNS